MEIRKVLWLVVLLALVYGATARKRSTLQMFLNLIFNVQSYDDDFYKQQGYQCSAGNYLIEGYCYTFGLEMTYVKSRPYLNSRKLKLVDLWSRPARRRVLKHCEAVKNTKNACKQYIFITSITWNLRVQLRRKLHIGYEGGSIACMRSTDGRVVRLRSTMKVQFLTQKKSCKKNRWLCADGNQCIKAKDVCNGRRNCRDGSDEDNCDGCSKTLTASKGVILSPRFPNNYPENVKCEWKLNIKDAARITIEFIEWDVEFYSNDVLKINDGGNVWYYYGETDTKDKITIKENYVVISFKSDGSGSGKGFNITYDSTKVSSSDIVITSPIVTQINTGFTFGYTNSWTYTAGNSILSYQISRFYMDSSCVLYIYAGSTASGFLLVSYTGSTTFGFTGIVVYTTHLHVLLICGTSFTLNPSQFRFADRVGNDTTTAIDNTEYGSVVSPKGTGSFYPPNANCKYRFTKMKAGTSFVVEYLDVSAPGDYILFQGKKYWTKSSLQSVFDGLTVTGGGNLDFTFISDNKFANKGFKINFSIACKYNGKVIKFGQTMTIRAPKHQVFYSETSTSTSKQITCQSAGLLSSSTKTYTKKCKTHFSYYLDAKYFGKLYDLDDEIPYKCNYGYHPSSDAVYKCTMSGFIKKGSCRRSSCSTEDIKSPLQAVDNAGRPISIVYIYKIVYYKCISSDYRLVGMKWSFCTKSKRLFGIIPSCKRIGCQIPNSFGKIPYWEQEGKEIMVGEKVEFKCRGTNEPVNPHTTNLCVKPKVLEIQSGPAKCEAVDVCKTKKPCGIHKCIDLKGAYRCSCLNGYKPVDGGLSCENINECSERNKRFLNPSCQKCHDTEGSYYCTCKEGYIIYTRELTAYAKLAEPGKFRSLVFNQSCIKRSCDNLIPANATRLFPVSSAIRQRLYKQKLFYICLKGYHVDGKFLGTGTCDEESDKMYWDDYKTCQRGMCPSSHEIEFGSLNITTRYFEDDARVECDSGYMVKGTGIYQCMEFKKLDGRVIYAWTGTSSCKPRDKCPNLSKPVSGDVVISGRIAHYTCKPGFAPSDNPYRFCVNGKWTREPITCNPVGCQIPDVKGRNVKIASTNSVNTTFKCKAEGYVLYDGTPTMTCALEDSWKRQVGLLIKSGYICNNNAFLIGCPVGKVIFPTYALYGYDYTRVDGCSGSAVYPTQYCGDPKTSLAVVKKLCSGRRICWIPVTGMTFNTSELATCGGKTPSLQVSYMCLPPTTPAPLQPFTAVYACDAILNIVTDSIKPMIHLLKYNHSVCNAEIRDKILTCLYSKAQALESNVDTLYFLFLQSFYPELCSVIKAERDTDCLSCSNTVFVQTVGDFCSPNVQTCLLQKCWKSGKIRETYKKYLGVYCNPYTYILKKAEGNLLLSEKYAPQMDGEKAMRKYTLYDSESSKTKTYKSSANLASEPMELRNSTTYTLTFEFLTRIEVSTIFLQWGGSGTLKNIEMKSAYERNSSELLNAAIALTNPRGDVKKLVPTNRMMSSFMIQFMLSDKSSDNATLLRIGVNYIAPREEEMIKCVQCDEKMSEESCVSTVNCFASNSACFSTWVKKGDKMLVTKGCKVKGDLKKMKQANNCYLKTESQTATCVSSCGYSLCNAYGVCPPWVESCKYGTNRDEISFNISATTTDLATFSPKCQSEISEFFFLHVKKMYHAFIHYSCNLTTSTMTQGFQSDKMSASVNVKIVRKYTSLNSITCQLRNSSGFASLNQLQASWETFKNTKLCDDRVMIKKMTKEVKHYCSFNSMFGLEEGWCTDMDFIFPKDNHLLNAKGVSALSITNTSNGAAVTYDSRGFIKISQAGNYSLTVKFSRYVFIKKWSVIAFGSEYKFDDVSADGPSSMVHGSRILGKMGFTAMSFSLNFSISGNTDFGEVDVFLGVEIDKNMTYAKCYTCKDVMQESDCTETFLCPLKNHTCFTRWNMTGNMTTLTKGCALKKEVKKMEKESMCDVPGEQKNDSITCASSCSYDHCNGLSRCPLWQETCAPGMSYTKFSYTLRVHTTSKSPSCQLTLYKQVTDIIGKTKGLLNNSVCEGTSMKIHGVNKDGRIESTLVTNFQYYSYKSHKCVNERIKMFHETFWDKILTYSPVSIPICAWRTSLKYRVRNENMTRCSFGAMFDKKTNVCKDQGVMMMTNAIYNSSVTSSVKVKILESSGKKDVSLARPGYFIAMPKKSYEGKIMFKDDVKVSRFVLKLFGKGMGLFENDTVVQKQLQFYKVLKDGTFWKMSNKELEFNFYVAGVLPNSTAFVTVGVEVTEVSNGNSGGNSGGSSGGIGGGIGAGIGRTKRRRRSVTESDEFHFTASSFMTDFNFTVTMVNATPANDVFTGKSSWSGGLPRCKDIQPPTPTSVCSRTLTFVERPTEPKKYPIYVSSFWPEFTDNSGENVTVTIVSPSGLSIDSSLNFSSPTTVVFRATDTSGNIYDCQVIIKWNDEVPVSLVCPPNKIQLSTLKAMKVNLSYEAATAEHISGISSVHYSIPNGTLVPLFEPQTIIVTAVSKSGVGAQCTFTQVVQDKSCAPATVSAISRANLTVAPAGVLWRFICDAGYVVGYGQKKEVLAKCDTGSWTFATPEYTRLKVLPPCLKPMGYYDLRYVFQLKLKRDCCKGVTANVMSHIKKFATCLSTAKTGIDVETTLKPDDDALGDPRMCIMALDMTIVYDNSVSAAQTIINCTNEIHKALSENNLTFTGSSKDCSMETTISTSPAVRGFYCPPGYFTYVSGVQLCIPCSKGYFYNSTAKTCDVCDYDTYQDEEAQFMCKPCPPGHGTLGQNSFSKDLCFPKCRKGEYREDMRQLQPCNLCPVGSYSDQLASSSCKNCSGDKTTASMGSTSILACRTKCPVGMFSPDNGLSRCTPCPRGQYQNETGQTSCLLCPTNSTTYGLGWTTCTEKLACTALKFACKNGGTCKDLPNFEFECTCKTGYTGKDCRTRIDMCNSSPCVFGTCQTLVNDYKCTCELGFVGKNCDAQDFCFDKPCKNNAKCEATSNFYQCTNCSEPYMGYNCDELMDACKVKSPCQNGGNCSSNATSFGYTCACPSSFTGSDCELKIDFCKSNPCKHDGVCVNESDSYSCNCTDKWNGTNCEIDVNECKTNQMLCLNNGTCVNLAGGYQCICAPGYEGFNCSQMIDTCRSNPCHPTANCTSNGIDYTCTCAAGYEGHRCMKEMNLCESNPCDANGTSMCVPSFNNYTCVCENGFQGRLCEETVSYCAKKPCLFGGRCYEGTDVKLFFGKNTKFYCLCPWYRKGLKCDIQGDTCMDNKCANDATCKKGTTNYTCECLRGFNGTLCENVIDLCDLDKPCKNGGTCVSEPGDYTCECATGWMGKNCSEMVDNCLKKPCLNGGKCTNRLNDFICTCTDRFEGETCSEKVDICLTAPCKNGGSCFNNATATSGFECVCPTGFEGDLCETNIDDCPKPSPCQKGSVCKDLTNDYKCECPSPVLEGKHCNKTKSGDFDYLYSTITSGLLDVITETVLTSVEMDEMSVQYWVRSFTAVDSMHLKINSSEGTLLELSTKSLKFNVGNTSETLSLTVTDGAWTSILVNVHTDMLTLYVNGKNVSETKVPSFAVKNGTYDVSFGNVDGSSNPFSGQITKFFWSKICLTSAEIENLKGNCSQVSDPTPSSNITFDWRMIASGKPNSIPTQCGLNVCPAGLSGATCAAGEDTVPPSIVSCSSDLTVVENVDLKAITFPEPSFTDNVGVVNIIKSGINSGDNLRPGVYQVYRVAVDAAGNEATCQFQVTFVKFQCEDLTAPNNHTALICSTSGDGEKYCQVSCKDAQRYGVPASQSIYFSCMASSGGWTPRTDDGFVLSECVLSVPATQSPTGSFDVSLPDTTTCAARRQSIIESFVNYMKILRSIYPSLCQKEDCSDLSDTVVVNCPGARRRKRSTSVSLSYSLPPGGSSSTDMCRAISGGNSTGGTGGVTVSASTCPTISPTCKSGYFHESGVCYACRKGTYMKNIYETSCTPCPKGYYTDVAAQTSCQKCPVNETTPGVGATSNEFCYEVCPAGKFLNPATSVCELCPSGTYQSLPGQAQCSVCRSGQTSSSGSIECTTCKAGEQLSAAGACVPCSKGFYRPAIATSFVCAECPQRYTTSGTGATKQTDCNIPICKAGEYRTSANVCAKCFVGTYQPKQGQTMCDRCPQGQTTASAGSMASSDCKPGSVDECKVGSHNCDKHATCKDTANFFTCTCNAPHWVGNGNTCACGNGYSGPNCDVKPAPPVDNSRVVGIAVGCVFAALVLIAIIVVIWYKCYYQKRKEAKATGKGYENDSYDLTEAPGYHPVVLRQMTE